MSSSAKSALAEVRPFPGARNAPEAEAPVQPETQTPLTQTPLAEMPQAEPPKVEAPQAEPLQPESRPAPAAATPKKKGSLRKVVLPIVGLAGARALQQRVVTRAQLSLEQLLDRLERGEIGRRGNDSLLGAIVAAAIAPPKRP